ncbi:hypothetical protein [Chryseobacterium sp. JUb7]|uniref:hypothetical protein n=1 Tax=Chryseobacterium sp. JUb7 TaxID=2940599 RepID=UPI0021694B22|nr:hypothetical protein [Chryseobacterium sp. JUb7]MCS3532779.1 hypothetical protein [Chryseobacterium sp. JUb7]
MCPLPELNLNLGIVKDASVQSHSIEDGEIVVRTDSGLRKHTITMTVSDQEVGKVILKIGNQKVEVPTFKLIVTDDKTNETEAYQVTRDTLSFVKVKTKRSILSFLGIKKFDKTSFLYENIAFEPHHEDIGKFELSKYRNLSENSLTYTFKGNWENVVLFAGNINEFKKPEDRRQYFIIVDHSDGMSFIGDILYREKLVKLTPKVELNIIRRNRIPKNFEVDEKGHIRKLIYL